MGPILAIPARARQLLRRVAKGRSPFARALTTFHVRNIIREANGIPLEDPRCRYRHATCERIRRTF